MLPPPFQAFNRNMHPNRDELIYIAGKTGLAYGKVQQWFNNQRAMEKRRRVAAAKAAGSTTLLQGAGYTGRIVRGRSYDAHGNVVD